MDHSATHEAHLSGPVLHPLSPLLLPPFLLPLKEVVFFCVDTKIANIDTSVGIGIDRSYFACVDDYSVLFMVAKHIFLFQMDLKELHVVISEEMCKLKRQFDRNDITKLEVKIV